MYVGAVTSFAIAVWDGKDCGRMISTRTGVLLFAGVTWNAVNLWKLEVEKDSRYREDGTVLSLQLKGASKFQKCLLEKVAHSNFRSVLRTVHILNAREQFLAYVQPSGAVYHITHQHMLCVSAHSVIGCVCIEFFMPLYYHWKAKFLSTSFVDIFLGYLNRLVTGSQTNFRVCTSLCGYRCAWCVGVALRRRWKGIMSVCVSLSSGYEGQPERLVGKPKKK